MSPKLKTAVILVAIFLAVSSFAVCCISFYAYGFFSRLGGHYTKKDGKVYWVHVRNHDLKKIENEVEGADTRSFKAYKYSKSQWGRDKNHVYFEGRRLRSADPETFKIVDVAKELSRDANNEYKGSRKTKNDGEEFVTFGQYSKDIHGVYWFDKPIPGADFKSFELVIKPKTKYKNDHAWARDKNRVYCDGRPLPQSDPKTFRLLGANYGVDKNRVFYCHIHLPAADPKKFIVTYHDTKYVVGDDGSFYYTLGVPAKKEETPSKDKSKEQAESNEKAKSK